MPGLTGLLAATMIVALFSATATALPSNRRFELVTPAQKNGADALPNPSRAQAALGGGALQYASLSGFGDVRGGSRATDYIAIRDEHGMWRAHGIFPVQEPGSLFPDAGAQFEPRYLGDLSGDLSEGVFMAKTPLANAPNVANVPNLYLRSDLLVPGAGAYEVLSDSVSDQGDTYDPFLFHQPALAGASTDFSHILFESRRSLLVETGSLDPTQPKLYEWVDGTLRFVGMIPSAPDEQCGDAGPVCTPAPSQAGQGAVTHAYTLTTISGDGRRVVFCSPDPNDEHAGQLYLRDDRNTMTLLDDITVHVNASERTTPESPQSAKFWVASNDGTKVFFTTGEKLTDDDPNSSNDLYRYDSNAPIGARLARVSVDNEPGDNQNNDLANGHDVAGAIGASQDGNSVYFIAGDSSGSQLIAGGSTAQPVGNAGAPGNARIYRWHMGVLHEVGGINGSFELNRNLGGPGWGVFPKWGRVSPDGRYLAIITQGTDQLLSRYGKPEYDHGGAPCSSFTSAIPVCLEVYVYDADANNGSGNLQCASCDPTGVAATGDADFVVGFALGTARGTSHLNHALSDDGRFSFFDSDDRLVNADKNDVTDPYEFDTRTGQVGLLSSGTSQTPSIFLDASADGRDVFIVTRSQLRSEDRDQGADVYDVRIGGTIDPGRPVPRICEGEGCRSAAVPTAIAQGPASLRFTGPGDRLAPAHPAAFFAVQALGRRERRHLARAGSARLTISASGAGRITVHVRARIDGRWHTIQTVHRTLKSAGTAHPRIRLPSAARRFLATQHRLTLRISATYSQSATRQTLRTTLVSS